MSKILSLWSAATAAVVMMAGSAANAAFTITLNFSGSTTPAQQAYFNQAKAYWESVITGYKAGVNDLTGITISADVTNIDGPGGILGSAGPSTATSRAGTVYTVTGAMKFDSSDYGANPNSTFGEVVMHEMAHVIGIGTLWTNNNLYVDGTGQYTGANALATYKSEFFKPTATFVPVELGGGSGTANGHWNENDGGGSNTGIKDQFGRDFRFELMTGWLDSPTFVSYMTRASFIDLGYTANVPEPTAAAMALPALALLRRRRSR